MAISIPRDLSHAVSIGPSSSKSLLDATATMLLYLRTSADRDWTKTNTSANWSALTAVRGLTAMLGKKLLLETHVKISSLIMGSMPDLVSWLESWAAQITDAPEGLNGRLCPDTWQLMVSFWNQCFNSSAPDAPYRQLLPPQVHVMLKLWSVRSDFRCPGNPVAKLENTMPEILERALDHGCNVEIRMWFEDNIQAARTAKSVLSRIEDGLVRKDSNYLIPAQEARLVDRVCNVAPRLWASFIGHDLVVRLTRILFALSPHAFKKLRSASGIVMTAGSVLVSCILRLILQGMDEPNGAGCTEDAIREGLLLVGLRCEQWGNTLLPRRLEELHKVLTCRAPYFNIARALRSSISAMQTHHPEELAFSKKSAFWMGMRPADEYVSLVKGSKRRCGAVECYNREEIGFRYRRCSSCKVVYYCSIQCQRQHWKVSGHRDKCESLRVERRDGILKFDADHLAFIRKILIHRLRETPIVDRLRELGSQPLNNTILVLWLDESRSWELRCLPNPSPGPGTTTSILRVFVVTRNVVKSAFRNCMFDLEAHRKWTAHLWPAERLVKEIGTIRGPRITFRGGSDDSCPP